MTRDLVIGIDTSTTAAKAVVWDQNGRAVAEGRATFELSSPQPGWGEQNAADWWDATGLPWTEIDFAEDLRRARDEVLPHVVRLDGA